MGKNFSKLGLHAPYTVNLVLGANAEVVNTQIPIDDYLEIVEAREVHAVAGTDGGGLTMTIEKLTGTTAPAAGSNMFKTSTFNLNATANTVQRLASSQLTALSVAQKAARCLNPGDRIGLTLTGVATAIANVGITLVLRRTRPGASGSFAR